MSSMRRKVLWTALLCWVMVPPVSAREWSDESGTFTIEAEFVRLAGDKVVLRKEDGSEIEVVILRLGKEDQAFLKTLSTPRPQASSRRGPEPSETTAPKPATSLTDVLGRKSQLDLTETPLSEAVEHIARVHGINVMLDRRSLDEQGIPANLPVSVKGPAGYVADELDALLEPLSLTWADRDGVLFITTKERSVRCLHHVHVYRVLRPTPTDELIAEIEKYVFPNSWDSVGGIGSVRALGTGILVIRQTTEVHRAIEGRYARTLGRVKSDPEPGKRRARPATGMEQIVDLDFTDTPLREVAASLGEKYRLKVSLDEETLAQDGIDVYARVTCSMRGVQLATALTLLLEQLDAAWIPVNQKTIITSNRAAAGTLTEARYQVRDLAITGHEPFLNMLMDTVAPASWSDVGGSATYRGGSATMELNPHGILIVRQTSRELAVLSRLFAEIRLAKPR